VVGQRRNSLHHVGKVVKGVRTLAVDAKVKLTLEDIQLAENGT